MKEVQWIDPDFLAPKDAWDRLSMKEKAAMMKVAVQNGITNLSDIRAKYNEFAEGGPIDTDWSYNSWKRQVAEHKGIRPDEDNTYDYEAYFNKYPEEAWKMLKGDPTAHFSNEFKTVYHPTFSSKSIGNYGSIYSGVRNPLTNPQGLVGGTWSPDYHTFTMSPDGYRGPVSMDDRKSYLENAEDNGVVLREADGSLPIYDGIPWGGVLPNVTVYGNKHAEGGNLFRGGGSIVSDKLVDMTIKEEGFNKQPEDIGDGKMTLGSGLTASKWHDLYRKRGNKWSAADNRMAVRQELSDREKWAKSNIPNWKGLPDSSKEALLMYKYNYDFNRANSPKLFAALEAGNLPEAARQMDATSKDPKFKKGLANRRKREQAHFMLGVRPTPTAPNDITLQSPDNTFVYNPYLLQEQNTTMLPQVVPDEDAYVSTHEVSPEEIRAQKLQESFDNINRFNRTMEMLGSNLRIPTFHPTTGNDVLDLLWATRGNDSSLLQMADEYAKGGGIHIKPSHRGRLTELKKRTGKTEAELYRTGSPAVRKMITFARNSRKWEHGLGGNLYDGTTEPSQRMNIGLNATNGWQPYTLGDIVANGENVARQRKALQDTFLNFPVESNDATAVANGRSQNTHLERKAIRGGAANAAWEREHPGLAQLGYAASAVPFAVASAPILGAAAETGAGQAVTAGLGWLGDAAVSSPLFTNAASRALGTSTLLPWLDAGMTAGFGAHGIQETAEGNFTPITALEVAPLGRLAKPIAKDAALAVENYRYPLGRPQVPEGYLTVKPQVRTRVGDVEIDTPNMAYRQGNDLGRTYQKYKDIDASVAQHQIEDNLEQLLSSRDGRPYISREKALDEAIANGTFDPAIGIEVDGHSAAYQDTPMYSDGFLWYGTPKIDETLPLGSLQSGLLVTPRNDAFIIGSNKATPYRGTGSGILKSKSGVTTVTDNGGRLIPADADNLGLELNNISAYNWEPGYGYRRVFAEEAPAAEWAQMKTVESLPQGTPWTLEQAKAAAKYTKNYFNEDVVPRLEAARKDSPNPRFIQNSPFLGRFAIADRPPNVLGETSPIILDHNGSKYTTVLNKNDVSPLSDKLNTTVHEMREDMIHYHKGMYDDDVQAALKHVEEYNDALKNGKYLKAAKLMMKYKKDLNKAEEAYYTSFLTPGEKDLIERAYRVPKNPKIATSSKLNEKVSENTRYRSQISRDHGGVVGDDLNVVIDNLSDDELLDVLSTGDSYGVDYRKYIEENPKKKAKMIANIKEALKGVGIMTVASVLPDMVVTADDE